MVCIIDVFLIAFGQQRNGGLSIIRLWLHTKYRFQPIVSFGLFME